MGFLYETHLHTSQASDCAESPGRDYISAYIDYGFTGIIVTDHFFNSNPAIDRRLPWSEWVNAYCSGYEDALNEGIKRNFDVFFGWEETFDGDDFLIYGLDREWLLENPELVRWSRAEQFREVRAAGGCVVQAHPFRQHAYIGEVHLSPYFADAIEAANAGNHDPLYDAQAFEYARILGLPVVAGSDIHNAGKPYGGSPYGVETRQKLSSIKDYVDLILNKGEIGLHTPIGRCDFRTGDMDKPMELKADIRDSNDKAGAPELYTFNGLMNRLKDLERQIEYRNAS